MHRRTSIPIAIAFIIASAGTPAAAQISGGMLSHPPEADSELGEVAYRYLRSKGWWPAHVLGTVDVKPRDRFDVGKTLVIVEWGISPSTFARRYYDMGFIEYWAITGMWSFLKPGPPAIYGYITLLGPYGEEVEMHEVSRPDDIP